MGFGDRGSDPGGRGLLCLERTAGLPLCARPQLSPVHSLECTKKGWRWTFSLSSLHFHFIKPELNSASPGSSPVLHS